MIANNCLAETVTYTKNAQPIFKERCVVCHNPSMMPEKDWMKYDIAKKNKDKIFDRVWIKKDMPQGNFTNMTEEERQTIRDWVNQGAKE